MPNPTPLPDLRRLTIDVQTEVGVFASGLLVEVLGGNRTTGKLRVCLDGPGFHLSRCRMAQLPAWVVTERALVRPPHRARLAAA